MADELLDRDRELAALREAIDAAGSGTGSVVLLDGPAGIGKTALLDAATARARERGMRVLSARASELDRDFTFGVALQLLEPPLATAGSERREALLSGPGGRARALFEPTAGHEPGDEPGHAVLSGLTWLVSDLADDGPLLLRVDDLHWTDAASMRFLEFLGRRLEDLPVVLVATTRTNEPGAPQALIDELASGPDATVLRPGALPPASAGVLLWRGVGASEGSAGDSPPAPELVTAAHEATGGNPLLLTVLAREVAARPDGGAELTLGALRELGAQGIRRSVERRLRTLGSEPTAIARAAAVAGERAPSVDLAALAELDADAAQQAVDALVAADVLDADGRAFVHPLVADAVLAGTPGALRAQLHRRCAERMRGRGERPAERAVHRMAVPPAGAADAVDDLVLAAREALREGATDAAIPLLERALAEPPAPELRPGLLLELGEVQVRAQQPAGAEKLEEALALGLDGEDAARAKTALAFLVVHNDPAAAFGLAAEARAQTSDRARGHQLEAFTMESLTLVDAFAEPRAQAMAAGAEDPEPSSVMLAFLALHASMTSSPPAETLDLARRAMADGTLLSDIGPGSSTWNLLTHATRFAEAPDVTERLLREGEAEMERRGLHSASLFVNQSWGYWHRDFGSVAVGAARAQVGYDAVRALGLDVTGPALAAILAENLVLLGRADEAAALLTGPTAAFEGTFIAPFYLPARGLVHAALRRHDEAEADFRATLAIVDARGWTSPLVTRAGPRLAELLAARGDRDEAVEIADRDIAAARAAGTAGALGVALRARARGSDGDDAVDLLREAAAALRGGPFRVEQALVGRDLGGLLRRRGLRTEARDVLKPALDLAVLAEAAGVAAEIRAELEAAGGRPRRERTSGADALTPSERRVVDLAVEGLTNRAIAEALWVTQKTVEHHLRGAYGKLGISSRAGLAEALAPASA